MSKKEPLIDIPELSLALFMELSKLRHVAVYSVTFDFQDEDEPVEQDDLPAREKGEAVIEKAAKFGLYACMDCDGLRVSSIKFSLGEKIPETKAFLKDK